jgi:uncharacterized protein YoxC
MTLTVIEFSVLLASLSFLVLVLFGIRFFIHATRVVKDVEEVTSLMKSTVKGIVETFMKFGWIFEVFQTFKKKKSS